MPDISPGRKENSPQSLGKLTRSQCVGVAEHLTTGFLTESRACPCRTWYVLLSTARLHHACSMSFLSRLPGTFLELTSLLGPHTRACIFLFTGKFVRTGLISAAGLRMCKGYQQMKDVLCVLPPNRHSFLFLCGMS